MSTTTITQFTLLFTNFVEDFTARLPFPPSLADNPLVASISACDVLPLSSNSTVLQDFRSTCCNRTPSHTRRTPQRPQHIVLIQKHSREIGAISYTKAQKQDEGTECGWDERLWWTLLSLPEEVWAKGMSPEQPRTLYMRLTRELFQEPEKTHQENSVDLGMSIWSSFNPPVGSQKSPERYMSSFYRSSLSPSDATKASRSGSLCTLILGVRLETSGRSSLSFTHSSNFAAFLHQQKDDILEYSYSSSSPLQHGWLLIFVEMSLNSKFYINQTNL